VNNPFALPIGEYVRREMERQYFGLRVAVPENPISDDVTEPAKAQPVNQQTGD